MRRVARKPSVTAGLRWPEMRIVAVIMIARMSPCAAATVPSDPAPPCAIMIAAPPTNTSANVPMNSAKK